MAQANSNHTTKLSALFHDPFLRDVFARAEDDGDVPSMAETDHPPSLTGGRRGAHDRGKWPPRSRASGA